MKIKVWGLRLEICWDNEDEELEPDTKVLQESIWMKSTGKDDKQDAYKHVETSARRTGLYL